MNTTIQQLLKHTASADKIIYITAKTPFGKGETFVLQEALTLKDIGVPLVIIPRSPEDTIFHSQGELLSGETLHSPLLSVDIVIKALAYFMINPVSAVLVLGRTTVGSRSIKTLLKNLAVYPKSLYLAGALRNERIAHIHAHWGTTPSTMAYMISQLLGIPWSLTLHRGDIKDNNLLSKKIASASFVRCISQHGKQMTLGVAGKQCEDKIKVIPMGVTNKTMTPPSPSGTKDRFVIATPANLIPVKGHRYLIDACQVLADRGLKNFACYFYGNGPLRKQLDAEIRKRRLNDVIKVPGQLAHEQLLELYRNGQVHAIVLPSIQTDDGEHEGIPVSLMEAMSYGIPVVSTSTGGIPELLGKGGGIMVDEKNPNQLAEAIEYLMKDRVTAHLIGMRGKAQIESGFDLDKNVQALFALMSSHDGKPAVICCGENLINKDSVQSIQIEEFKQV